MSVIWKFPLALAGTQMVVMPKGATVVHVAEQFGKPCIWAIVDERAEREERTFIILGTGTSFDANQLSHLGSFMLDGGEFVGHLAEPRGMNSERK